MATPGAAKYKDVPLNIVGSTKFGQHPFMSSEETFNMLISDGYFTNFPGFKRVAKINPNGSGRGLYTSNKLNIMLGVIDNNVYTFDTNLSPTLVGNTTSAFGDVFISENNNVNGQIVFTDQQNLYIYDHTANNVTTLLGGTAFGSLGFRPGYLTYQNGRIISPDLDSNQWRLSNPNAAKLYTDWPGTSQHVGAIQTKPDFAVATIRFPGLGNLLYVFGETVAEPWQDVGAQLFPYQRSQSSNIDYGCLNPATIAELEDIVCWLGINEKSGPVIMYSNGRTVDHLSTDGIDYVLSNLQFPESSYGFMFKQFGHTFYVLTFVKDNLTYVYDFTQKCFYTLSDQNMDYFPAKRVAFFNGEYYFVSINDGNLYQMSGEFTDYDYGDGDVHVIPRIRICPEIRLDDQSYFISGYIGFNIESGLTDGTQRVDMTLSKDHGVNYSNTQSITLPGLGKRTNRLMYWNQGIANNLTPQFRFYGFDRFSCSNGITGIFQ